MFRELCGEKTLKNVVLMTNMWGRVTPQQGMDREEQLKTDYFRAAIDKGAQLYRHTNTPKSARAILRAILQNQPLVLKIQRELIDERMDIGQTGAGAELNREIREVVEKYQSDIKDLEVSMRKALEEKDEESREEMEMEKARLQGEMERLRKESEQMASQFEDARREMEERISARFEERLKRLQEGYEEEIRKYEDKVKELERDGHENASQIKTLKQTMTELRKKANEARKCSIM